jgi:hypothetical protein
VEADYLDEASPVPMLMSYAEGKAIVVEIIPPNSGVDALEVSLCVLAC